PRSPLLPYTMLFGSAHRGDALCAGGELRERGENPEQRLLLRVDLPALLTSVQLDQEEGHQERPPGLRLDHCERVDVQRQLAQRLAKSTALGRVRARQGKAATHESDGADAVP